MFYLISVVILIGIIAGALYFFRPKAQGSTVLGPIDLRGRPANGIANDMMTLFTQEQVDQDLGNNFTLSFFLYCDDGAAERVGIAQAVSSYKPFPFLSILGVGNVAYNPVKETMVLNLFSTSNDGKSVSTYTMEIPNVVIQKWNQITITVEGRTVDVYLNGVATRSVTLDNLPVLKPIGVYLQKTPDFSGQVALFQAWPVRKTLPEIASNYAKNTDTRGKPLVPLGPSVWSTIKQVFNNLCSSSGICGKGPAKPNNPLQYVEYQYA